MCNEQQAYYLLVILGIDSVYEAIAADTNLSQSFEYPARNLEGERISRLEN